jgi:hypothetical protein
VIVVANRCASLEPLGLGYGTPGSEIDLDEFDAGGHSKFLL